MNVSKEIIIDLLPLYFDGEASKESQELVEIYFDENPEFAKDMTKMYKKMKTNSEKDLSQIMPIELNHDDELTLLSKTKKLNNLRTTLLFIGLFTLRTPLLILTFADFPMSKSLAFLFAIVTILSWVGYFKIRNRMKVK